MPENPNEPGPTESAEVRTIRHLVRLMHRYDLTAIDLTEGDSRIRLRRRGAEAAAAAHAQQAAAFAPPPAPAMTGTLATPPTSAPPTPTTSPQAPTGVFIESPMVGTYYASSSPDAPPYVSVGSAVRPETTICVIEAMKVFTDIPAGVTGTIAEILVKNGQAVEFGQVLFRVNPA